jgi:hypothetical protein
MTFMVSRPQSGQACVLLALSQMNFMIAFFINPDAGIPITENVEGGSGTHLATTRPPVESVPAC